MKGEKFFKAIEKFSKKHWPKWTILAILGIIIYLSFVFYQHLYKPIYQPQKLPPERLEINKQIYQEVMDLYNQREENISKIISKDYPDPFR